MSGMVLVIAAITAAQIVAIVFLVAGLAKLFDRAGTVQSIEAFHLLPTRVSRVIGGLLPWLELGVGLSLLTPAAMAGAVAGMALLPAFSVAQSSVLLRGLEVPCGCFGSLSVNPVRWRNVLANLAFAGCCFVVIVPGYQAGFGITLGHAESVRNTFVFSTAEQIQLRLVITAVVVQFIILHKLLQNRNSEWEYRQYLAERRAASAIQRIPVSRYPTGNER